MSRRGVHACDPLDREAGSRDRRMLGPAIGLWTGILGAQMLHGAARTGTVGLDDMDSAAFAVPGTLAAALLGAAVGCGVAWLVGSRSLDGGLLAGTVAVTLCAALVGAVLGLAEATATARDPMVAAARDGPTAATVAARVDEDAAVSSVHDADCQAPATSRAVAVGRQAVASHVGMLLTARGRACTALVQGAVVLASGRAVEPAWGRASAWLEVRGGIRTLHGPGAVLGAVGALRRAFFDVTDRLSDQGRVLVPGLTLGVLGQDRYVPGSDGDRPVQEAYAQRLEESFRAAGIMHLMAVSGGHFVLVAAGVRRLCRLMLLPRLPTAALMLVAQLAMAAAMTPSDSVVRALAMGAAATASMAAGRRPQTVSALCWTVIAVLTAKPSLASSFGFALSAAAVLGICLFAAPLTAAMRRLMPAPLASALAVTLSAQAATLPLQTLMEPSLPVLSPLANLLVAPFVGLATLAGLAALACAACCPDVALACARLSSCGTLVMERVALLLGGRSAAVPWAGGPAGAVLTAVTEALVAACAVTAVQTVARRRRLRGGRTAGRSFAESAWQTLEAWLRDTGTALGGWGGDCPPMRHDGTHGTGRQRADPDDAGRRRRPLRRRPHGTVPVPCRARRPPGRRKGRARRRQDRPLRL